MYDDLRTIGQSLPKWLRDALSYPVGLWIDHFKLADSLKNYSKFVRKGDLVFDVGANRGHMTDLFIKLGARVVCVEPQKELISRLKKKYRNNPRVSIVGKGLGAKKGKQKFYYCPDRDTSSSFIKDWHDVGYMKDLKLEERTVEITTMEDLIKKYGKPKFIKIDVEGYESEVLKGLKSKVNALSFEFTEPSIKNVERSIKILEKLGSPKYSYTFFPKFKFVNKRWLNSKQLLMTLKRELKKEYMHGDIFVRL